MENPRNKHTRRVVMGIQPYKIKVTKFDHPKNLGVKQVAEIEQLTMILLKLLKKRLRGGSNDGF